LTTAAKSVLALPTRATAAIVATQLAGAIGRADALSLPITGEVASTADLAARFAFVAGTLTVDAELS
jgi:hypothetical protein